MQLKPGHSSLAAACCALLGHGAAHAIDVDTAVLTYVEPGRVTAVEAVLQGSKELGNGHLLGFKFVYDALTGASANGATPAHRIQTFTRPSGQGTYTVGPDKTPLDSTFRDNRFACNATWTLPLDRVSFASLGGNFSTEADYFSVGASGTVSRDLFLRNMTLSAGLSASADRVNPQGGTPTPLTPMVEVTEEEDEDDFNDGDEDGEVGQGGPAENKTTIESLFGVSQILDRSTVAQLNYSVGHISGYQTDPYKLLSVVADEGSAIPGDPVAYLYEGRPHQRTKQSVYGELRRRFGPDVANASYRYFWDDWGVRSHTWDLHYHHQFGELFDAAPHLRYYRQREAEFYHRFLIEGAAQPGFASADYRLGSFDAATVGLELSHALSGGQRLRIGAEYYLQQGDSSPPQAFGTLRDLNLFPKVDAIMVRIGYSARLGF